MTPAYDLEEAKKLRKELEELKRSEMDKGLGSMIDEAEEISGVKLIVEERKEGE